MKRLLAARAWRVSAHDLEQLVCRKVASKLADERFILELTGAVDPSAEQLQAASDQADVAAATLRSGHASAKAELLAALVRQVLLHEDRAEIELDADTLCEHLGLSTGSNTHEPALITIPAVRVRRGQLRLIVPGLADALRTPRHRDAKLVALISEAQQAKELVLTNSDKPIAAIARQQGRCRTRLGKLVSLACLAPDIVTAIVEGRQPKHLSAGRLMNTPLPLAWADQRRELGFS